MIFWFGGFWRGLRAVGNSLLSVGLDVGTTTTQLIFSRLTVTNRASSFCVPMLAITDREILYKSPVHFTPLLRLRRELKLPGTLAEAGARLPADREMLVKAVLADPCCKTNPMPVTEEAVRQVLHQVEGHG
jgi:hypothetical protein